MKHCTIAALICFAPAPFSHCFLEGKTWVVNWGQSQGEYTFNRDGTLRIVESTFIYSGKWKWDSKKTTLTVKEFKTGNAILLSDWEVRLPANGPQESKVIMLNGTPPISFKIIGEK